MRVELRHLPAQDDFYNAQERDVAFVGGLGCGKTRVGSDDILRTAMMYPYCGQQGDTPGIAIFSNTYPQLIDGTMATFFERCEQWKLKVIDKIRSEHKIFIPKFNAWIGVWSADNPDNYKSLELCHIWIDEAQKWDHAAFLKATGRVRGTERQRRLYPKMPLRVRVTANPPWTMDHWLVEACTKPTLSTGKPLMRLITAATMDNPFLPADYLKRLWESYDPEIAAIELGGKFGEIGKGRIWRMFSRNEHVWNTEKCLRYGLPPLEYDPKLPLCWSHDFNVDPLCSVLFQWRRIRVQGFQYDVMYVVDEMSIRHSVVDMAAKEFDENPRFAAAKAVAERSGLILYGDATGSTQTNRQTGESDFAALIQGLEKRHLWGHIGGQKNVNQGNPARIDRYASGNRKLIDLDHRIGVVISDKCINLIQDLERMYFKPGTRLVEVIKYKDGQPVKLVTHLADAWSYPIAQEYPVERTESAEPTMDR